MTRRDTTNTAEQIVARSFHTADAEQRMAEADAAFVDEFVALRGEARAARWRMLDRAAKFRLVARMCERQYGDWSDELVRAFIAKYDARWEAGSPESDLVIPPAAEILAVAKERQVTALDHDDYAGARQLDRVRQNIDRGARLSWSLGDLLIQSVNNPGQVYSANRRGCTCPNGAAGKAACWHVCLFDLLLDMQQERADAADAAADLAEQRREFGRRLAEARRAYMEAA